MRILVTGGAGYLGNELCAQAEAAGLDVLATQYRTPVTHGRPVPLDVRDADAVERALLRAGPNVVVHTAYVQTGPDQYDTIVRGSHNIAVAAARIGARLVHLSTDLVFDGQQGAPYVESDEPRPVLEYGVAKAEAELRVADAHPEATLVRTSLLYGNAGGAQERLAARGDVTFYEDEIRCPTRVGDLAAALLELAAIAFSGPLHLAAPDAVSRVELARILRGPGGPEPTGAPSPPGRPRNVALDSSLAAALLQTRLHGVRG
jgi:dTDP-4-dehydrorhamnose reductase